MELVRVGTPTRPSLLPTRSAPHPPLFTIKGNSPSGAAPHLAPDSLRLSPTPSHRHSPTTRPPHPLPLPPTTRPRLAPPCSVSLALQPSTRSPPPPLSRSPLALPSRSPRSQLEPPLALLSPPVSTGLPHERNSLHSPDNDFSILRFLWTFSQTRTRPEFFAAWMTGATNSPCRPA